MAPAPPPDVPAAQPHDSRGSPAEIIYTPTSAKAIWESDEEKKDEKAGATGTDHWCVQFQDIEIEAPLPTLRPSGVQLSMEESAAVGGSGPGSDGSAGSGVGEHSNSSLHLLASSPSWTGTVDDKTSGQNTFVTSRSVFTPMSPDITVHLHSPSVRSTRNSWFPKPEEIAEVQMPKYFSGQTNACSKHPSMLQGLSPMREAGVLKTLINVSSDEARRQQTDVHELQKAFDAHVAAQGIRGGSQILIFTSVLLLIYRGFWLGHRLADGHTCEHWPLRMEVISRIIVCCVEGLWWATSMVIFILCHTRSNILPEVGKQQLEMHEPSLDRTIWLYHVAVVMFLMHVHLMSLPPLSPTCRDVIHDLRCSLGEQEALDCGMQGPSHMMFGMIMVFLSPHVIPWRKTLMASLVLYLVFYIIFSIVTIIMEGQAFFNWADVTVGFVLLFAMSGIALYVKNAIVKKLWDGYAAIFSRKKSSMMLLTILEYMLPNHLVLPMLRAPTSVIATRIETASILFLEVVNFKRLPMKNPEALLNFLNALFTLIDGACEDQNVTKVETVGEEYVACVGVVPADVASTLTFGHSRALIRMIRLCTLLLRVQEDEEVMLKMGLHSGPVVAGVIGQKLPRFRLFGDTVNMAARMMQTGVDGELQFSRETLQILKQSPVEVRAVQREGLVDIKGKGKVIAFLLAWRGGGQGMDVRQHAQEMRSVSTTSRGGVISAEPSQDNSQSTSRRTLSGPKSMSITTAPSQKSLRNSIERLSKAGKAILDSSAVTGTSTHSVHLAFDDPTGSDKFDKDMTPHRKYQMAMKVVQEQTENNLKATSQAGNRDAPMPPIGGIGDTIEESGTESNQQLSMRRTTKTSSDSLFELQRSDIADFWDRYYVNKLFGKNARQRLDVHVAVVGVLSVLEAALAILLGFAKDEDNTLGAHPLIIFGLARVGMIAFLISLRVLASDRLSPAVIMKPFVLKFRLFSLLMMTLLAHVSYAVLILDIEPLTGYMTFDEVEKHLQEKPLRIRIWSLLFLTQYFSLLVEIRLPSSYVLVFTVISTGLNIGVAFVPGWDIGLLMRKDILFFCAMNLIGLRLSLLRAKNCLMDHEGSLNVEKTTAQLEGILRGFIPPLVLEDLKRKSGVLPTHSFKRATVVQSDLVGFTALASKWNPEDVVRFIRDLFGRFDELTDQFQIWKIETVGDAYIAGQAEPPLTDINDPTMVVRFALSIIKIVEEVAKRMQRDHEGAASISCRCGVHTGECIGGVVGERMQRYHLFGDLLSELDLLESTAGSGQVQVSHNCYRAIEDEWMRKCDESPSGMIPQPFRLRMREEEHLVTSKGKMVEYSQVGGGPTYLVDRSEEALSPLRLMSC